MTKVFHFDDDNNVVQSDWPGPIPHESDKAEPGEGIGYWARLNGLYSTDREALIARRLRNERRDFSSMHASYVKSIDEMTRKWLALEAKLSSQLTTHSTT